MRKKPEIIAKCVASQYAGTGERIVEFAGNTSNQGGLISLRFTEEGKVIVELYRLGADVEVRIGKNEERV